MSLNEHKPVNSGESHYECDGCFLKTEITASDPRCEDYDAFCVASSYTDCDIIQTRRKSYACNLCRKFSSYCSELAVNQRTNTGYKPYKCNQWGSLVVWELGFGSIPSQGSIPTPCQKLQPTSSLGITKVASWPSSKSFPKGVCLTSVRTTVQG